MMRRYTKIQNASESMNHCVLWGQVYFNDITLPKYENEELFVWYIITRSTIFWYFGYFINNKILGMT